MNILARLRSGLSKTRTQIAEIVGTRTVFDAGFYSAVEDALVAADVGVDLTIDIVQRLEERIEEKGIESASGAYRELKGMLAADLRVVKLHDDFPPKPWVVLVVGVNGVGKTTTIGKMAQEYREKGKWVMLGAADTFRAGAIEQLKIWSERTDSEFVAQHEGADPASVAYDALEAAKARKIDVLLLDTAGRLHNKVNLMNELEKIVRVMKRNTPHAPNEVLLVLDATTGQNALKQAEAFHKSLGLTGLVITKLDGTAKGGMALSLTRKLRVPIRKIGVGEGISDLQDFDPVSYVEAMFGDMDDAG